MNIVLTELYPLNRGKPARARKRDSSTSHDAAARAEADTRTHWQRQAIRAAVSEIAGLYKTDDERDGCKVWKAI